MPAAGSRACCGSSPRGSPTVVRRRRSAWWWSTCGGDWPTWRPCRTWSATPARRRRSPTWPTGSAGSSRIARRGASTFFPNRRWRAGFPNRRWWAGRPMGWCARPNRVPTAPARQRNRPAPALLPPGGPSAGPGSAGPPAVRRRYLLLVDDYDLLPMANGSPLLPLLDLLGLGRELGLHLVLARRVAGAARAGFEPVVQRLRELGGPGLVMCGDPGEGPVLGGQRAAALPLGRGFYVCPPRGTTLVQAAYRPPLAAGRPPRPGGG